jgi:hypothetical protein
MNNESSNNIKKKIADIHKKRSFLNSLEEKLQKQLSRCEQK